MNESPHKSLFCLLGLYLNLQYVVIETTFEAHILNMVYSDMEPLMYRAKYFLVIGTF